MQQQSLFRSGKSRSIDGFYLKKINRSNLKLMAFSLAGVFFTPAVLAGDRPLEPLENPGECPIDAPVRVHGLDSLRHFEGLLGHCSGDTVIESPAYQANQPRVRDVEFDQDGDGVPDWDQPRIPNGSETIIVARAEGDRAESFDGRRGSAADEHRTIVSRGDRWVAITPARENFAPSEPASGGLQGADPGIEAVMALRPQSYTTAYDEHIAAAARRHGVDPLLLHAVIKQESGYRMRAVSHAGARGLMQVMPATGRMLGVSNPADLFDPHTNINAGARLLSQLWQTFDGNIDLVLAAYNAGEGAVRRHGMRIPPYRETQNYVVRVKAIYTRLAGESGLAVNF